MGVCSPAQWKRTVVMKTHAFSRPRPACFSLRSTAFANYQRPSISPPVHSWRKEWNWQATRRVKGSQIP